MTPEEKAVIEAAMSRFPSFICDETDPDDLEIASAVQALIFACPQCNAGGHTCPGDGNPIGHTATDCGRHDGQRHPDADGSTYPCWECLTDPTEDPRSWCDCRPEDFGTQDPGHPCRLRAHAPSKCLNRPTAPEQINELRPTSIKIVQVKPDDPVWVTTTMENCLINDRIRLGTEEATVLRSNRGIWNVGTTQEGYRDGAGNWYPVYVTGASPWFPPDRHVELRLELDGPTAPLGFNPYPPDLAVEILCTPERLAVLRIQEGFPGSAPISSHVN